MYSFQISVHLNRLCNSRSVKGNKVFKETSYSITVISRAFKLITVNFYCCYFNGRAVPSVPSLEFVCKYRVESRVEMRFA